MFLTTSLSATKSIPTDALLLFICAAVSVILLVLMIWFSVLCAKMLERKRQIEERTGKEQKKPTKTSAFAAFILAAVFPLPEILTLAILIVECGILIYAIVYFSKELKKPLPEKRKAAKPEPEPKPEPKPEPEIPAGPTEEEIKLVESLARESITIEEAHIAITDEVAVHFVEVDNITEEKKYSNKSIVNVDTISANYASGETVNLDSLKQKNIIPSNSDYVKVLARGILDKRLTVEAQSFSADAVKMIILTGGKAHKTA